jgi:hypothetical protein
MAVRGGAVSKRWKGWSGTAFIPAKTCPDIPWRNSIRNPLSSKKSK